jgi:hypothetical protein
MRVVGGKLTNGLGGGALVRRFRTAVGAAALIGGNCDVQGLAARVPRLASAATGLMPVVLCR